jgi:anthranilate/para-aminobenzoate synthase component I
MDRTPSCSSLFLDSGNGWLGDPDQKDRYISFGAPAGRLYFKDGKATVMKGRKTTVSKRDPLSILEGYLTEGYTAAGYIGYEYSRFTDAGFTPGRVKDGDIFPDIYFNLYKNEDMSVNDMAQLKYDLSVTNHREKSVNFTNEIKLSSNMDLTEYKDMVVRAKSYIESGDIYQANLSQRYTAQFNVPPLPYFLRFYGAQPVPYGCYMDFGGFQLISGSMELFLRRSGNKLLTRPIKGTRRRGQTEELDTVMRAELVGSSKERAENLMIVDLMRNDLGRICEPGSVKVNNLFEINSFSTLHQMVSEVEGTLSGDKKVSEIIDNVFPPGSVTGAPKKRTLEVIDELEPHLRGPYCGALGIFYPDGDFVLSVGIRLLVTQAEKATFWVGGGIVWDSDPEKEYEETLLKSYAVKKAFGISE